MCNKYIIPKDDLNNHNMTKHIYKQVMLTEASIYMYILCNQTRASLNSAQNTCCLSSSSVHSRKV